MTDPMTATEITDNNKAWWKDTTERLVWTFIEAATGTFLSLAGADALFEVIELGDASLWIAAGSAGVGSVISFFKALAAKKLSEGGTAQLGAHTYSYTEAGPGSAGGDLPTS